MPSLTPLSALSLLLSLSHFSLSQAKAFITTNVKLNFDEVDYAVKLKGITATTPVRPCV